MTSTVQTEKAPWFDKGSLASCSLALTVYLGFRDDDLRRVVGPFGGGARPGREPVDEVLCWHPDGWDEIFRHGALRIYRRR